MLVTSLYIYIYLSNRPHFLLVYWCNKPTRDVGRTREKLVNHEPQASDLQAFRVFSQHPKWVYYTSKPIENAVYCFYEITRKKDKVLSSESMFLMVIKLRLLLTIIM